MPWGKRELLGIFLITPLAPAVAPAVSVVNLALHCPFSVNVPTLPGWMGLVDGEKNSDSAPGCFATANTPAYPKLIVLDLQGECLISKLIVYNSANGNTRTVGLASSLDGRQYKKLREPDFIFPRGEPLVLTVSFQPRKARYIRVAFLDSWKGGLGGDHCLYLRELEIYGQRLSAARPNHLALAAAQPPFVRTRAVALFRRYCLETPAELHITLVGDLFALGAEAETHWMRIAATELSRQHPEKKIELKAVTNGDGLFTPAMQWAQEHRGRLAPDLIILAFGLSAALQNMLPEEFRRQYQLLLDELTQQTAALIVLVTPPPLPSSAAASTLPYEQVVEQLAAVFGTPLLRTATIVSKITGNVSPFAKEGTQLSPTGQQAIGRSLAELLAGP